MRKLISVLCSAVVIGLLSGCTVKVQSNEPAEEPKPKAEPKPQPKPEKKKPRKLNLKALRKVGN